MDPFTHAAVGLGLAALTGQEFSWSSPVYAATIAGALAPDMDIVIRAWGEMAYLGLHRALSHSIPGVLALSLLAAGALSAFMPHAPFMTMLLWALAGGCSHVFLDILNSYGVRLFWPFSQRSVSLNILLIFDPLIFGLFFALFAGGQLPSTLKGMIMFAALLYLTVRSYTRRRIHKYLSLKYRRKNPVCITVMPSSASLWAWNFLVETPHDYHMGQLKTFPKRIGLWKTLRKPGKNTLVSAAMNTRLGKFFRAFTPHFHVYTFQKGDKNFVRFLDLRYCDGINFLHSATAVFDEHQQLLSAVFHPFGENRRIPVDA